MSEPKLISPMLDNFMMGDPISEHNGIRCCPALEKETEDKYIVKIISVPAFESQLDALVLSGAYKDTEAALGYFKQLTDEIVDEINVLNRLSEESGYLPLKSYQVVSKEDGTGFDLYILSPYCSTLERRLRRSSLTHLEALNLGLDLCSALSVARNAGYIYVDLKPENIYLSNDNSYRIGDIGFLKLNTLKYASLPDRYRSDYTAPEITDAYSALNDSIDVYALGLILYQVFHDGNLPVPVEGAFPPPDYADYEMSEIILKACAQDPAERWQSPAELSQALVDYMQRNGAHNTPIVPLPEAEETIDADSSEDDPGKESVQDELVQDNEIVAESAEEDDAEIDTENISEEAIYSEDSEGNLTFLEGETDETMDAQDPEEIDYDEVTEEVSDILLQADDLIAHEAPEPVVQPEPIDVPVPPLEVPAEDDEEKPSEEVDESEDAKTVENEKGAESEETVAEGEENTNEDTQEEPDDDSEVILEEDAEAENPPAKKAKRHSWIWITALVLLATALIAGGIYFYKTYYMQTIDDITCVDGGPGELTVRVSTETDEEMLTVVCTDTYGIQQTCPVTNGEATFTQLTPNAAYVISVEISGFHRLTGTTTTAYTSPNLTEIVQFTAVTGAENGSVILNFSINGPDSERWVVSYINDVGSEERISFSGHMVTFSGLTTGSEYLFTLAPESELLISGVDKLAYVATPVVKPEKLHITGCIDNSLQIAWSLRPNANVASWTVRCYNDSFDETLVVTETAAEFKIPDPAASYTVEVTAAGMSVSERILVSANSIIVNDFAVTEADGKLLLSWNPVSVIPESGSVLSYTVGGSAPSQVTVGQENRTELDYAVPGSEYRFTLQSPDGVAYVGGTRYYTTEEAQTFSGYSVEAANMEFMMCRTPSQADWNRYYLSASDYTTTFSVGEKASFLVKLDKSYSTSDDTINTLFVIKDAQGAIVSTAVFTDTWRWMWLRNYCELDIPSLPQTAGDYTISTYFNGAFVNSTAFSVVE